MTPTLNRILRPLVTTLLVCALHGPLSGCGGGSGGGGVSGSYTSVDVAEVGAEFRSDGTVVFSMGGERGQPGTYTVDGEKILVDFNGQKLTFVRDGDCIEDLQRMFGKLCKGGAAGAARNVSTRTPAPTTGTWAATNADGTFTLALQSGGKLTFSMTPAAGSQMGDKPMSTEGTFELEGDTLFVSLADGAPMVLKWVNGAYESSAFGLPMRFMRK